MVALEETMKYVLYSSLTTIISLTPTHTHTHTHTCSAFLTKMLAPLQSRIEQWKRTTALMDKEHDKGDYKRSP